MPAPSAIVAENLSKSYGERAVFSAFSFSILAGRLTAVTGPNGAGKTTLLKVLSTLLVPDEGEVRFGELRLSRDGERIRRGLSCGWVNMKGLFPYLSVRENLELHTKMHGVRTGLSDACRSAVQELTGDKLDLRPSQLSTGMRQAVQIAKVLSVPAGIIVLDEPYISLDAKHVGTVNRLLNLAIAEGQTVILSAQAAQLSLLPEGASLLEMRS